MAKLKIATLPNSELTKLRKDLGLSKTKLAVMLGVHRHTIERWEKGLTPTPYHVMQQLTASLLNPKQG